jgi:hypothetical protein
MSSPSWPELAEPDDRPSHIPQPDRAQASPALRSWRILRLMIDMHFATTRSQLARVLSATLLLALLGTSTLVSGVAAQEGSAVPSASPTVEQAACSSADDLRLIIGFIGDSVEAESGLIPVGIGVIAAVSEARSLAGLVGEVFRPLVDDLVVSLQDLRDTIGDLDELETAGAKLASVGEAVTDIGNAMDSLSVTLQTSCPSE